MQHCKKHRPRVIAVAMYVAQRGVGVVPPSPAEAPAFRWYLYTLCIGIRRRRRIPLDWNVPQACSVTKPGQQSNPNRCKKDRLIHLLDPVGKGVFLAYC